MQLAVALFNFNGRTALANGLSLPQPAVRSCASYKDWGPIMVKSPNNPDGLPISVFDDLRRSLAANRAQFYHDFASKPFYGFIRPGAKPLDGVIANWWRQGMTGGTKAHYDGIKAFSETDVTEDLKNIEVPTLVMQGEDDQVVPYKGAALLQVKLLKKSTLKRSS
jgi:non-heme chloroperoxidase